MFQFAAYQCYSISLLGKRCTDTDHALIVGKVIGNCTDYVCQALVGFVQINELNE